MMKLPGRKLFFIPGLCWGILWIKEFFLYPELWFFAYCAAGVGIGFLAAKPVRSFYRDLVGSAALALLALLPDQEIHSAVFPLVFGYYGSWMLDSESADWQKSRSFSGGFMLGAVMAVLVAGNWAVPLLLFCTALTYPGIGKKVAVTLLAVLVFAVSGIIPAKSTASPSKKSILPGEAITALSWVKPDGSSPQVVFFGGDLMQNIRNTRELAPAAKRFFYKSVAAVPAESDLIFAVDMPEVGDGGIRECARKLKDGGVLVVPVTSCSGLPDWQWQELPGSGGFYAAAGKGRKLVFDPDQMDANFSGFFRRYDNQPLAGALAGMLISEKTVPVTVRSGSGSSRWIWLGVLAGMSVVLAGYALSRLIRTERRRDLLTGMLNTAGQALLTVVLLPELLDSFRFPGVANVLIAFGALWFIRRATGLRSRNGKNISWGLFFAALACGIFTDLKIFLFAALIFSGNAYADMDEELQFNCRGIEPLRFLAIACGIGAAWLLMWYQLPLMYQLIIAGGVRFYSWLRN